MMKRDGRDSTECQNWEKNDIVGINVIVYVRKRQTRNSACLLQSEKGGGGGGGGGEGRRKKWISFSRERVSSFSLRFYAIRPLAVFGTRRKTALRGEGFVWIPDLRSLTNSLR